MSLPVERSRQIDVEVAIVGGGLAGTALAARLAHGGQAVTAFERSPAWRWRACGVFASPAAVAALRRVGLDETTIRLAALPTPAMRIETPDGTSFRLTYGTEDGGEPAVGFDRARLDPAMVALARSVGADVRAGTSVTGVDLDRGELAWRDQAGRTGRLRAAIVVGADGSRSTVARAAGVARPVRLAERIGLTFHVARSGRRDRARRAAACLP